MLLGSEAHFRSTMPADVADTFLQTLRTVEGDVLATQLKRPFGQGRTAPSLTFDWATSILEGEFDGRTDIVRVKSKGQILWVLEDTYGIRVKKMGEQYRPSNHGSDQQTAISGQDRLDGMPSLVYVTLGTRFNRVTGLPEEHVIVKHYPGRTGGLLPEWVIPLEELASGQTMPVVPAMPFPSAPAAATISVRHPKQATDTAGNDA